MHMCTDGVWTVWTKLGGEKQQNTKKSKIEEHREKRPGVSRGVWAQNTKALILTTICASVGGFCFRLCLVFIFSFGSLEFEKVKTKKQSTPLAVNQYEEARLCSPIALDKKDRKEQIHHWRETWLLQRQPRKLLIGKGGREAELRERSPRWNQKQWTRRWRRERNNSLSLGTSPCQAFSDREVPQEMNESTKICRNYT